MTKQLTLTISDEMWEEYKTAISIFQGVELDEQIVEEVVRLDMLAALRNTIEVIGKSCKKERMNE